MPHSLFSPRAACSGVGNGLQKINQRSIFFCAEARRWQWDGSATPANGRHVGALAQTVELLADILSRRLTLGSVFAAQLMGMFQQFAGLSWPNIPIRSRKVTHSFILW